MPSLDYVDRLATLSCLMLGLLLLICAPLAGVFEVRSHVYMMERKLPIKFRGGRLDESKPWADSRHRYAGTFVCMDFVCVNRSSIARSVFEQEPSTLAPLQSFPTFASCVQSCVASAQVDLHAIPESAPEHFTPMSAPAVLHRSRRRRRRQPWAAHGASSDGSSGATPGVSSGMLPGRRVGYVEVGNQSLDESLRRWLDARHVSECDRSTAVYFVPFSPNGIGNKVLGIVMGFHMALMEGRKLVVSDWPPRTLDTSYALGEFIRPSSCQQRFDADGAARRRPAVTKCTVVGCPTRTQQSYFSRAVTQAHWAHMSPKFLELPAEWAHLDWIVWWRAITQYLLTPGSRLLDGLSRTLDGYVAQRERHVARQPPLARHPPLAH